MKASKALKAKHGMARLDMVFDSTAYGQRKFLCSFQRRLQIDIWLSDGNNLE